ncbi:nucleoside-diphosphate-sugar epimerase [Pedobacter sp. CAN_A7]|uniref:polysaccharide biosynthesis protein n=1 Tax=Pedobacter sp. CAN_A7 TaxID=2787722 RepID=UPI0018C92254
MINSIYNKIWEYSPEINNPGAYLQLQHLTKELIELYNYEGRLEENPFTPTTRRKLSLPHNEIKHLLKNETCLVTGGLGCVGSCLVNKLLELEVGQVIIIDNRPFTGTTSINQNKIVYIEADVRDLATLEAVFEAYQPAYVFHTAAQRNPGYAEHNVVETVTTNVLGTLNVVRTCEKSPSVKQCVFSSTGKSSRYYTNEVYSATKKICEYIFDTYAKKSSVIYSMVRFTHILDNSLMDMELRNLWNANFVAIHSPGKYVTAQNVMEAADLLLNALIYSEKNKCNFLIVRNLEWPVESLEVALYYIKQAERDIPIIFKGNPIGYTEKFFRGQLNWAQPQELNLLINVYESRVLSHNAHGDIIISHISATDTDVLAQAIVQLEKVEGELQTKECLLSALKNLVRASLVHVNREDTLNILKWGLQPEYLFSQGTTMVDYGPTVPLLMDSLNNLNVSYCVASTF